LSLARRSPPLPPLPDRIGPVEFTELDRRMVAVRCPRKLAHIVERAGGVWDPDTRRWLIRRKCMGTLIDPLFRCSAACRWTDPQPAVILDARRRARRPARAALGYDPGHRSFV
jgi:hypothetical protein